MLPVRWRSRCRLANGTLLDLELSALEGEEGRDHRQPQGGHRQPETTALIRQGTRIPCRSPPQWATSVTFKKAGTEASRSHPRSPRTTGSSPTDRDPGHQGETVPTGTGDAVPSTLQSITTQVLVNNGETLVLGGIYQQTIKMMSSKVPLLKGTSPASAFTCSKTTSETKA